MEAPRPVRSARLALVFLVLNACGNEAQGPDVRGNALKVIRPYHLHGTWVFDDPATGLRAEPFVQGIPEMIDALVADIPTAKEGFRLTFSGSEFPGHEMRVDRREPHAGGWWYADPGTGRRGWLCPAMFKYFHEAPPSLYGRADPTSGSGVTTGPP
jgi:hypothetical protein